jgi:hypothetical protein
MALKCLISMVYWNCSDRFIQMQQGQMRMKSQFLGHAAVKQAFKKSIFLWNGDHQLDIMVAGKSMIPLAISRRATWWYSGGSLPLKASRPVAPLVHDPRLKCPGAHRAAALRS